MGVAAIAFGLYGFRGHGPFIFIFLVANCMVLLTPAYGYIAHADPDRDNLS